MFCKHTISFHICKLSRINYFQIKFVILQSIVLYLPDTLNMNDMSNFKVGDRVVCVDNSIDVNGDICTLKKDAIYSVQSIHKCNCGIIRIDVGAVVINVDYPDGSQCGTCGIPLIEDSIICNLFNVSRFRKVIEQPRVIRVEVERTEPILN